MTGYSIGKIKAAMNKSTVSALLAILLIAIAGPALAKKADTSKGAAAKTQAQRQTVKTCRRTPPPFMNNPRFMNRGFFKRRCRPQDQ